MGPTPGSGFEQQPEQESQRTVTGPSCKMRGQ